METIWDAYSTPKRGIYLEVQHGEGGANERVQERTLLSLREHCGRDFKKTALEQSAGKSISGHKTS